MSNDIQSIKWIAIAAMSENRVIGKNNALPWHLPDEFRWFKRATTGKVLLMGRKTFESIGKPLPKRRTLVLSRHADDIPGVDLIRTLDDVPAAAESQEIWICGGAELYRQTLPMWNEAYITVVRRHVDGGDAFFPEFESDFDLVETVEENEDFRVLHYVRRRKAPAG